MFFPVKISLIIILYIKYNRIKYKIVILCTIYSVLLIIRRTHMSSGMPALKFADKSIISEVLSSLNFILQFMMFP